MLKRDKLKKMLCFSIVLGLSSLYRSNVYAIVKGSSTVVNKMIGIPWSPNNPGVFVSPQFFAKTLELTIENDSKSSYTYYREDLKFNDKIKREVKISGLRIKGHKILSDLEKTN